jgi:hypothetical protein
LFITVVCECGHLFEMPEGNAGLYASCPAYARILVVPKPAMAPDPDPDPDPDTELFVIADEPTHTSRPRRGKPPIAGIILGVFGCLVMLALFLPAVRSAREYRERAQCTNNLKQIGLAMHNYHTVYDCLPPSAIVDKNGKPLLSWRVALVPYLESSDLYSKFHLDEPWDSPHNLTLLDKMPSCYACPSDATLKPGMTGYQAIIGPSTSFTPDFKPLRFADITDGTANTILIGESKRAVPGPSPRISPST